MPIVHFLNVKNGDCSVIIHDSGHVSVIDVCNARKLERFEQMIYSLKRYGSLKNNFFQKENPVNPIEYMVGLGIGSIFRFILTHPDMDHMDGLKDIFEVFRPINFYDIKNSKSVDFSRGSPYRQEDWLFYKYLRDNPSSQNPTRFNVYSPYNDAAFRTKDWFGNPPGDSFYILAPSYDLVTRANETGDYNDCSYVLLVLGPAGSVLFCGDSHDNTWEHIFTHHITKVINIDLLIAPHHGRHSNRSFDFLDILNPKMTFFGNAPSENLAYAEWYRRKLPFITNNTADCMVVDLSFNGMPLFVTNESLARKRNPINTFYSNAHKAWFLQFIK